MIPNPVKKSHSIGGGSSSGAAFAYGHDNKKFRLRTVSAEKDVYSKFISKPTAKKITTTQIVLAIFICLTQVVTISLVVGRYSYDNAASCGVGIWVAFSSAIAALQTRWSIREPKYWKLHVAFALHIINCIATIFLVVLQFGGNIPSLRYRLGEALYDKNNSSYYPNRDDLISVPMLITSLVLNSFMGCAALGQLFSSFVMTLMSGRAICCGQSKLHGKIFELEVDASENKDGVIVYKKGAQNNEQNLSSLENEIKSDIPPPYQEAQIV